VQTKCRLRTLPTKQLEKTMTLRKYLLPVLMALTTLSPLALLPGVSHAQGTSIATPRIDGFDVEPAARAAAGNELFFTLYGSPGGRASVQITGGSGILLLEEVESGVYEGLYTIRARDQISANSSATANLRLGNRVATNVLDEPLIKGAGRMVRPTPAATLPAITRFEVDPPARLVSGSEMFFSFTGTPGGIASTRIPGVRGKVMLNEISSGVYEGVYTIKNRDRIANDAAITANLRVGEQETTVALGYPLMSRLGIPSGSRRVAQQLCVNCGVVEAVNVIEVQGDGNYIGPILGGIAGAVLGSQVGSGRGTTVAQIAGAVGGAVVGREVQKRTSVTKHYEVVVRLDNGGTQTISYPADPGMAVGTRIRVENGTLVRA